MRKSIQRLQTENHNNLALWMEAQTQRVRLLFHQRSLLPMRVSQLTNLHILLILMRILGNQELLLLVMKCQIERGEEIGGLC